MSQLRTFFARRGIWLLLLCMTCHTLSIAQTKTVSGTVTDKNGNPLQGATVQVKNTKQALATDAAGKFSIPLVSDNATLIISMTGYSTQSVAATTARSLRIILTENRTDMDEVVVVGYGKQKKSSLTGSVAQINGDDLKQAPAMNISNLLAGRLPGLVTLQQSGRPGADDAGLYIRGLGTLGDNGPTIIVDGVQRGFFDLDPNEIESISILKDAAAAAVYGFQGANGVILVTTKRGKAQAPTISYTGARTVNSNTRFPKFMNAPDYMTWFTKAEDMDNDYRLHTLQDPSPHLYTQAQIDAVRNGTNKNPLLGNSDWIGALVGRHSISQQHNISVRGGTDKVKYFTTIGYLDQDGVVDNTGYRRYNIRNNLDVTFNKVLSATLDLGGRLTNTHTPGISPDDGAYLNPFYQAVRMLPNMPMTTTDGFPTAFASNGGWINPIATVQRSGYQQTAGTVFQSALTFNVHIPQVKGLEFKVLTAYDKSGTENKSWITPFEMRGRYISQLSGNWTVVPSISGITRNTLRQSYSQDFRETFQPQVNYSRTFGDHAFTGLVLYEYSRYTNSVFSTGASNFALTDIKEINFGSKATNDIIAPTGGSGVVERAGYVSRLNYGFKERYLFELSGRYDGSYNFAKNKRWGFFPAVSAGWVISKESFFNSKTVSYLKLKGSVGKLGNDRIPEYQYLHTFGLTTDPVQVIGGVPVSALYTNAPPNPNITWEKATIGNLGVETSFWNGLLSVDADVFYKVTTDILTGNPGLYAPSVGNNYPSVFNSGIVDNRGIDLQIRHHNKINKLEYSLTGNFNWARNKIIRMDENPNLPFWQRRTGRPIGEKFGFVTDGFYQTWAEARDASSPSSGIIAPGFYRFKDLNGDGKVTRDDDMTFIGRSNLPEIMYGLNLQVKYGIVDFSALFQGAALSDVSLAGAYEGSSGTYWIEDNTPFTKSFYGGGNSPYYLVEQAWTPTNKNARFPRLTSDGVSLSPHNANANSGYIVHSGYLRLKSAQIGISLPENLLRRIKFQQCRLYVSGFNLFTWDKLKYIDPEMPNVNNGFYPQQRMVSIGANITF